ncbi:MAG: hypothetical protein ACRDTF_13520 [Pseudonocardiaceae bacterium]
MGRDVIWVAGVVLALAVGMAWLLWPHSGSTDYRLALGTVVRSADCGAPEARDALQIELLDGRALTAQLDGCGNRKGEVLSVEVPDPLPADQVLARLAGTGVPAATATAQRLAAVEVALAGIAGALLAWRLRQVRS